jgi:molybdate/tungstate transport system substrate-binding protein
MRKPVIGVAIVALLATGATAIAGTSASAGRATRARAANRGTVDVLYAGSLVAFMERGLGPAFEHATGYGFSGIGGGSTELAAEIKGGVRRADVFVSASSAADAALEGARNGRWVSWYTAFMASPLMLAYNPHSHYGEELRRGVPWYRVLTQSGIRVGRTDPKLDPKGVLTVEAVERAASRLHDPALSRALPSFEVFPETGLVGRLQSGQLDAGFFYAVEAKKAGLATVALAPVYKYANYTVTVLAGAPDPAAAAAFVRYLVSSRRAFTLTSNGLNPISPPQFHGSRAAVPATLRTLVGAR